MFLPTMPVSRCVSCDDCPGATLVECRVLNAMFRALHQTKGWMLHELRALGMR
jgi:hypothetical protein